MYVADRQLLNAIAGFNIHRGCLAIARRPEDRGIGALPENATRALVLEDVGDADNVGAAFRNAAAFGVDAVLITSGSCDPLYRKAVRVSMGAVLQVPFGTITDLAAAVIELKRRSFTVIALTPGPDAVDIRTLRPNTVARAVLMLGSEGEGLSKVALAAADVRVRIPISTAVDSLNVATAAAIGLWVLGSLGP